MKVARFHIALAACLWVSAGASLGAETQGPVPPNPYRLMEVHSIEAPTLDVTPLCLDGDSDHSQRIAAGLAEWDRKTALEMLQELRGRERAFSARDLRLLGAILDARVASDEIVETTRALAAAIREGVAGQVLACAQLELARLHLHAGLHTEVRTDVARALRNFRGTVPPAALRDSGDFYRAESFYREGRLEDAAALYTELVLRGLASSKAARLRLADMAYVANGDELEFETMRRLLADASALGTKRDAWAPRLAEWKLDQGHLSEASAWLDEALASEKRPPLELAAISLRRADLLYLVGEDEKGSELLRGVSETATDETIRQLALLRHLDWDRDIQGEALRQLERSGRSENARLAAYARGLLANRLIARGEHAGALDLLVRLVHANADDWLTPELDADFDAALQGLAKSSPCEDLLAAMAGRSSLLLRHTARPEPFLQLGDCYLELGMATGALDTYRDVAKTFGPEMIERVTLRTALAEFQSGRVGSARAAAEASIARHADVAAQWRLLYAEILLGEGDHAAVVSVLLPLLTEDKISAADGTGIRALEMVAGASQRISPATSLRRTLRQALASAAQDPEVATTLGEATLQIADLYREAGEIAPARALYKSTAAVMTPGLLRSRAIYWDGVLADKPVESLEIWKRAADSEDAWARLAANEIELADERPAVGRPRYVPPQRKQMKKGDSR